MGMDEPFSETVFIRAANQTDSIGKCRIGAVYSHRFVNDVNQKAQEVFSHARQYLQQHQDLGLSPYAAYESR